ncbi:MAG: 2-dehydro-3-deoxy-D-gluconate 5-dehydrogenase KduD [Chloroflexi bacterium]|jgi:2-deoxy-D-gluconate 3-dehydrogenase|nr:2-dehydro-3-deoxy-D-gluconate 5-dehydrogenase KduD [Chloroflexota bacterium]
MILDKFSLEGKVALVTGASRGLGQGIALGLAEAGADIAAVSRGACEDTAQKVKALGRRFLSLPCDLAKASVADLDALVERTVQELGRIDILVNNAGINIRHPAAEFPEEDWETVMQVNLKCVMFLSQAAARRFLEQGGGKIINVASALSFQGGILVPPYTASKHAVLGLTREFANEWAAKNINVNAIAPGYMLTDLNEALVNDPVRCPAILSRIPAGRWGTPEDLQGAAVFLASDAANYCHGSVVVVDGAWLTR